MIFTDSYIAGCHYTNYTVTFTGQKNTCLITLYSSLESSNTYGGCPDTMQLVCDFYFCGQNIPGEPGLRLNMKTVFLRYGDFHVKDKTVARPSCL